MFNGLSFYPFSSLDDGFGPAEVDVCGRHIPQTFMVAPVIVMLDERLDLGLRSPGRK